MATSELESPSIGRLDLDFTAASVIVTGAARGIGLEVAIAFRRWGADVFVVDLDAEELDLVATKHGLVAIAGDVTSTADVERVVQTVIDTTGRVDVLINNAGLLRDKLVWKLDDDDWDAVMAVHLGGAFRFTRACVPHFRKQGGGRVLNVTSYSGLRGNVGQSNYSAAKAGIIGLTRTTAKELARFAITVNAISPNAETRMVASIPPVKLAELAAAIPMGYFADPSEMAAAFGFLASDAARYITGVVVPVDGGISI